MDLLPEIDGLGKFKILLCFKTLQVEASASHPHRVMIAVTAIEIGLTLCCRFIGIKLYQDREDFFLLAPTINLEIKQ